VLAKDVLARLALGGAAGEDVREPADDLPRLSVTFAPLLLTQRQRLERAASARYVRQHALRGRVPRGGAVGDPAQLCGLDVEAGLEPLGRRRAGRATPVQDRDGDGRPRGQPQHGQPDLVHGPPQRRGGV
jgi:hypothetical protein